MDYFAAGPEFWVILAVTVVAFIVVCVIWCKWNKF